MARLESGTCELCGRRVDQITRHHLIPRTRHHNKRNKRQFDREEVHQRIALLCRPCHSQVHAVLYNKSLEREYNTLEALSQHPEVARFCRWIADKPAGLKVNIVKKRQ
ncbi:MAG: hypothetical protein ACQES2_05695 [Pseudomonadota bacterium]